MKRARVVLHTVAVGLGLAWSCHADSIAANAPHIPDVYMPKEEDFKTKFPARPPAKTAEFIRSYRRQLAAFRELDLEGIRERVEQGRIQLEGYRASLDRLQAAGQITAEEYNEGMTSYRNAIRQLGDSGEWRTWYREYLRRYGVELQEYRIA